MSEGSTKESAPEISSTKIITSRPWLNMQQEIRRSGKTCVSKLFTINEIKDKNNFNFNDIIHIYNLHKVSHKISHDKEIQIKTEVYNAPIRRLWPYNKIITPAFIRKKVDPFCIKNKINGGNTNVDTIKKSQTGLYRELLEACENKKKLKNKIEKMDSPTFNHFFHPTYETLQSYTKTLSQSTHPTLTLFFLEFERMYSNAVTKEIKTMIKDIHQSELLEDLGCCLFFSFLLSTTDPEYSISNLIRKNNKIFEDKDAIQHFIKKINEDFLLSANIRRKIRK